MLCEKNDIFIFFVANLLNKFAESSVQLMTITGNQIGLLCNFPFIFHGFLIYAYDCAVKTSAVFKNVTGVSFR